MRKRDPSHQAQLDAVQRLPIPDLIRRSGITDHNHADHVASEVLATLLRNRFGLATGVVEAAVVELNRRIQVLAGKRMQGMWRQPEVQRLGDRALQDTIDYVWDHFYDETVLVSNSEVRFAVYVRDRVDEFMRHLRTNKNSMKSVDEMQVADEDGNSSPFIDTVADENAESPEEALMRKQLTARVLEILIALPSRERNAFYFRLVHQREWRDVARLMGCSIPTATKYYEAALQALKGALE